MCRKARMDLRGKRAIGLLADQVDKTGYITSENASFSYVMITQF